MENSKKAALSLAIPYSTWLTLFTSLLIISSLLFQSRHLHATNEFFRNNIIRGHPIFIEGKNLNFNLDFAPFRMLWEIPDVDSLHGLMMD